MAEMLSAGLALSVRTEGAEIGGGLYRLRRFVPEVDYCDPHGECWITSIAKNRITGEIFASLGDDFHEDDSYERLFSAELRGGTGTFA